MSSSIQKPNRRKEIKEKQNLQAKLQWSLSQSNKNVVSWLMPQTTDKPSHQSSPGTSDFMDLPILPNGAGLSSLEDNTNDLRKVGDFMTTTKLNDVKPQPKQTVGESGALAALRNKLRDSSRSKIQNNSDKNSGLRNKQIGQGKEKGSLSRTIKDMQSAQVKNEGKGNVKVNEFGKNENKVNDNLEDSDDEEQNLVKNRSVKKGILPIPTKKNKKGRPF